jgi:diguanylate cyclase (GGDEF)-like protein/PAS domain S-box-containing protein
VSTEPSRWLPLSAGGKISNLSPEADLLIAALHALPIAVVTADIRGIVRSVNAALTSLTGYTAEEAVGQPIALLSFSTAKQGFYDILQEAFRSREPWRGEWVCRRKNGDRFTSDQSVTAIKSPNGEILNVVVTIQDITGRKQAEEDLRLTTERREDAEQAAGAGTWSWNCVTTYDDLGQPLRMAGVCLDLTEHKPIDVFVAEAERDFERFFNLIPDLACIVSTDGYFKKVNRAWETTLGFTLEEVLKTPMLELIHPDDLERTLTEVAKQSPQYRTKQFVNRYRCKDGSYRLFEWATTFTRDDSTRFGVARDITDQRLAESAAQAMALQLAHSAEYDFLTGLPNRTLLNDRVSQAIDLARRQSKEVSVLFLDLDGFKHINDSLGHLTGDKLLQSISKRLVACVRGSKTVTRQGGDEFVVLLSEVEQSEDTATIARRLLQAVAEPHSIDQHDLFVTASIGASVYPNDGLDAETLIKNADTAMYQAKENGRQNCQFFKPAMNVRAVERQSIEESLRRALERRELAVHYQPKIDLRTGEITGAEALLRWTHPIRGLVSPAQFIPVAEDCGLILPIGKWVLREACQQARAWVDAGLPMVTMAVNISAMEFRNENFLEGVFAILMDTGLDPRSLELELTESVLMKHSESAASILKSLRARGVRVAVDDFGTGYSSLSYLRKFPVDALKIDPSFVRQITTAPDETTIVTAVIGMARSLKLRVIAEGVETQEELAFLQAHQCSEAQGHYFSGPVAPQQFARLLKTGILKPAFSPRSRRYRAAQIELTTVPVQSLTS